MLAPPVILSSTVDLAYNLSVLQAHFAEGGQDTDLVRGVARHVDAETYERANVAKDDGEAVLARWRDSALRQSLARFGKGEAVMPSYEEVAQEINRLKAVHPEMKIRLMEKLFGIVDALVHQWNQRFWPTLDSENSMRELGACRRNISKI